MGTELLALLFISPPFDPFTSYLKYRQNAEEVATMLASMMMKVTYLTNRVERWGELGSLRAFGEPLCETPRSSSRILILWKT